MKRLLIVATLSAALPLLPATARAGQSVAIGGFTQNTPSRTGAALMLSTGASVPQVPLEVQGTFFQALAQGGGYAATAEIRGFTGGGYGGAYVGAGAGIGDLSANRSTGTVFSVFAGKSIAPLTSLELRLYKQTSTSGATAGFVGLRFSF